MEAVRLLLALAAHEGWEVHHMDVKTAFLNGDLQEVVFVEQAPGLSKQGKNTRYTDYTFTQSFIWFASSTSRLESKARR
jgi:hypothetical protein